MFSDSAMTKYLKSIKNIKEVVNVFMLADARNITMDRYDDVKIDFDDNVVLCYTLNRNFKNGKNNKDENVLILEHVIDLDQVTGILYNIDYLGKENGPDMDTIFRSYLGGVQ